VGREFSGQTTYIGDDTIPLYQYECNPDEGGCGNTFEIVQGYHDKPLKRCKVCRKHKLHKIITKAPYFKQQFKTVGSLADANTSKLTQEQKDKIRPEEKPKPDPPWGKPPKGLANLSQQKQIDYIITGKL
jgi:putative FmdB family regulatory protein